MPTAAEARVHPSLKQRLVAFFAYALGLYFIGGLVTGLWLPTGGGEWLWWGSAIALYLVTTLQAPFFHRPRDSLANSVVSVFMLFTADTAGIATLRPEIELFRWLSIALVGSAGVCSVLAILAHGSYEGGTTSIAASIPYRLATSLGNGVVVFTPPALLSIVGFHQSDLRAVLWLSAIWIVITTIKPVELLTALWNAVTSTQTTNGPAQCIGLVTRVDDPNIIRVALAPGSEWNTQQVLGVVLPGRRPMVVLPLFVQTMSDGLVGTGICNEGEIDQQLVPGEVWAGVAHQARKTVIQGLTGSNHDCELVGFIVEGSTIAFVQFEAAGTLNIDEGTVVFVRDRNQTVYYQVISAVTQEEVFTANPRGTHIVRASQLGTLEADEAFHKYGWVPAMNTPVFLINDTVHASDGPNGGSETFTLGKVPRTGMSVTASLSDMAAYHTAVLGVTGTGKTELVLDLIEAHLRAGRKVFCVDCTGEYQPRLAARLASENLTSLGISDSAATSLDALVNATEHGTYGAPDEKKALHNWVQEHRSEVEQRVAKFMTSTNLKVGVFDLPDIANTRATLRATEMYISAIFHWARNNRRVQDLIVVLEEAHTVVPEWNLFRHDKADTDAVVGRMSQVALQGRKYGVGLLLVSQRTALVSKTLLSQCNTCICFAMYDKTGLDYLESVFASEHVRAIPQLRFLQGIAFGKGIKSERPIIFEIPFDEAKKQASDALNQ